MFGREVAMALNTLNLLVVQKANAASESCNLMLRKTLIPSMKSCIIPAGFWINIRDDPRFSERLQSILEYTREIRQHIFNVEEQIIPESNLKYSQLRKGSSYPPRENIFCLQMLIRKSVAVPMTCCRNTEHRWKVLMMVKNVLLWRAEQNMT